MILGAFGPTPGARRPYVILLPNTQINYIQRFSIIGNQNKNTIFITVTWLLLTKYKWEQPKNMNNIS